MAGFYKAPTALEAFGLGHSYIVFQDSFTQRHGYAIGEHERIVSNGHTSTDADADFEDPNRRADSHFIGENCVCKRPVSRIRMGFSQHLSQTCKSVRNQAGSRDRTTPPFPARSCCASRFSTVAYSASGSFSLSSSGLIISSRCASE